MPDKKTIAVTVADESGLAGQVHQHFGHAPYFLLVEVTDGKTGESRLVANPYAAQHQPGQVPDFIKSQGADVMISGGMGGRAVEIFTNQGISVATGAKGTVQEAIDAYLSGSLRGWEACNHEHSEGEHHRDGGCH